jgi:glycine reductase
MLLKAVNDELGIPGVTGFGPDNPGIDSFRRYCWIVPAGRSTASMRSALTAMAKLALKLGRKEELGPAAAEGYMPRGFRLNVNVGKNAAVRAVEMALARLSGGAWETELKRVKFDEVPPPAPIEDISQATIALVTEAGLVPAGNPDHLETRNATKWFHYPIKGDDLQQGEYEAWHGGHITTWVNQDPDRNVPVDATRSFEREGFIGKLYGEYLVTTGNMTNVSTCQKLGREMGDYLKSRSVTGVILTAT